MLINVHTHNSTGSSIKIVNFFSEEDKINLFSIGIHPWESDIKAVKSFILPSLTSHKNCFAIGEIGLDKLKGPDLDIQKRLFTEQIILSEEIGLPVIIHCVKAWNELKSIKREIKPDQQWIFHGFSKTNLLREVLNEGIIISIGADVLTNQKLQQIICLIPDQFLFLETDTSEVPISDIYKKVSELKNISLETLEKIIEVNFKRVFKKWTIG